MKPVLHGLRHGRSIPIVTRHGQTVTLVADTKSDPQWVYLNDLDGNPLVRQTKEPIGRRFRQSCTNPDRVGYDAFPTEWMSLRGWTVWSDDSDKGEIFTCARRML